MPRGSDMRPIQESAWRLEAKWKAPSETLTKTQEDAHREVLAIVEARTVVYRDAVTPYMEESILTLRALIPGSGKLHLSLNTRTGHRARGVYQHQGQGTGRGCICIRVGVYQHHGQGTRRGACSSTMDRAHRAVSAGTGELA